MHTFTDNHTNRNSWRVFALGFAFITGIACLKPAAAAVAAENGVENSPATDPVEIEELTIYGQRTPDQNPLGFTFSAEQLQSVPGVQNDKVSAIVTFPGVAVLSDFDTGVAIRGSRPENNRYYLDFLPVGYVFHLTGLSVVDSDVVSGLDLYGAGFDIDYQGVVGGVIDVHTRDPVKEGFSGLLDASLLDAGVLFEGAVSNTQRALVSTRVSYYDAVLGSVIEKAQEDDNEGVDIIQLPKYRDYRGRYQIDLGEKLKLDLFADGAADKVAYLFDENAANAKLDPVTSGRHSFDIEYNRVGMLLGSSGEVGEQKFQAGIVSLQRLMDGRQGNIGTFDNELTEKTFRTAYGFREQGNHQITVGGNLTSFSAEYDIAARDNGCTEFDVDCRYSDDELVSTQSLVKLNQSSFFLEDTVSVSDAMKFNLGLGYTRDNYLAESAIEPRLRMDIALRPNVLLSVSAGRYYELPPFEFIDEDRGNRELEYLKSNHFVAGVDVGLPLGLLFSLDIYRKTLDNLITSDATTRYDNDGKGLAHGLDVMLRKNVGQWSGWLSLSLSRSEREDRSTGTKFLFEYDQPLVASLVLKREISDRLTVGGRVAYHTGPPVTPILGGIPDTNNAGSYDPIYGDINSERLPNYFRTDLRLDWQLKPGGNTSVYFEVVNATNQKNVLEYEYTADYATRKDIAQLPFFVSFGISKRL